MHKHRALTGFLCRNWERNSKYLNCVCSNCDVSLFLGALPFELRRRITKSKISSVTHLFHAKLQYFLERNIVELSEMTDDKKYDLSDLGGLFDTKCVLFARGGNKSKKNPWSGAIGFVCKMSFPEIDLDYALKLFYQDVPVWGRCNHGPLFEIPTAFAAGHAEPRDNNRVYLASLSGVPYLMSRWAGDDVDTKGARKNKNQIFITATREETPRNRRNGQRIDWGETYLCDYGAMSYRARKMFRQIMACDGKAFGSSCDMARDGIAKKDVEHAMRVADLTAYFEDNFAVQNFLVDFLQR